MDEAGCWLAHRSSPVPQYGHRPPTVSRMPATALPRREVFPACAVPPPSLLHWLWSPLCSHIPVRLALPCEGREDAWSPMDADVMNYEFVDQKG